MNRSARSWVWVLLLCPPWGLLRMWRGAGRQRFRALIVGIGLVYGLVWLAALGVLAVLLTPLDLEWRGGFPPVLTLWKTKPDYAAVDRSRTPRSDHQAAPSAFRPGGAVGQWPGFRGPRRDGYYDEMMIRTNWVLAPPRLLWRQPCGAGYASFTVAGGLAFTIEQRRSDEVITAYDLETGREVWAHRYPALFTESMGGEGPRATPAWHDGRVFALGATGEFHCLDAGSGTLLWKTNILAQHAAENLHWGQAASPLIVGDTVIVIPGGPDGRTVVAYDQMTGRVVWAAGNGEAAYSSPVILELAGQRQLLVAVKNTVWGLAPDSGQLLWEFPWVVLQSNRSIAQPLQVSTNRFLLAAGYGTGSAAVEIRCQAGTWTAQAIWRNRRSLRNKFSSSVLWQGNVYGLDEDTLCCVDPATGETRWRDGKYGYGQLLLASGHLIVLAGDGDLALVAATPERWAEIARIPAIRGKTWNHPAMAGGLLLIRNMVEMACFDVRPPAPPAN